MNSTLALAAYGALLSTALATWTIYTWMRSNRTRVRITVAVDYRHPPTGPELRPGVFITIVNDSHHAIRVVGIGYEAAEHLPCGWLYPQAFPEGARTPVEIPARDSFTTWLPRTYLEGYFHSGGGRARLRVQLSTGKIFKTRILRPQDVPGYLSWPDELPTIAEQFREPRKDSGAERREGPLTDETDPRD